MSALPEHEDATGMPLFYTGKIAWTYSVIIVVRDTMMLLVFFFEDMTSSFRNALFYISISACFDVLVLITCMIHCGVILDQAVTASDNWVTLL